MKKIRKSAVIDQATDVKILIPNVAGQAIEIMALEETKKDCPPEKLYGCWSFKSKLGIAWMIDEYNASVTHERWNPVIRCHFFLDPDSEDAWGPLRHEIRQRFNNRRKILFFRRQELMPLPTGGYRCGYDPMP